MLDILEDFLFSFQDPTGLLPDADADPQPDSGAAATSEADARWACSCLRYPCFFCFWTRLAGCVFLLSGHLKAAWEPRDFPVGGSSARNDPLPCPAVPTPAPTADSHHRSDEGGGGEASEAHGSEEEEDYVRGRRGSAIRYFRLDGSTKGWQRQAMMDSFNSLHCKVGAALS